MPVWVTPQEREFGREGAAADNSANLLPAYDMKSMGSKGVRTSDFLQSHDVYGDGSIIVVPAPGHTPSSVIIFVTCYDGARYALVGDLVWRLEGIRLREERPWLISAICQFGCGGHAPKPIAHDSNQRTTA